MKTFYDTLKVEYACCPPDCLACEEACFKERNGGVGLTRIVATHAPEVNFHMPMLCNQCSEPSCEEVCPTGAIVKDKTDGIVRITEEKCIGCGLCTLACPYGGITFDPSKRKPWKCDLCDGAPKCVDACPHGVLSFIKSRSILNYFQSEDLFSPGRAYCPGCVMELATRFSLKVLGKDTFIFCTQGCSIVLPCGRGTQASTRVPSMVCAMTNVPSCMTGVKRYYRSIGKDVKCVAMIGDGCASDVGFQPLSGAAERDENLIIIVFDNEGFMNTGIQRSGTTPHYCWTTTTPVGERWQGKTQDAKNMPLIMVSHGLPYVATATIAYPEDYARKLTKAMAVKDGMAYIHLFSPCHTGWRARADRDLEICQMAVETNYFPLWEAEKGALRLTYEVDNPRPIQEYTKLMGKFSHLEEDLAQIQEYVNERFTLIKSLPRLC